MKKKDKSKDSKEIVVKSNLSFEELMKQALNTPLPKLAGKKKKK